MNGTSQSTSAYISLWDADEQAANTSTTWPGWLDSALLRAKAAGQSSALVNARFTAVARQFVLRVAQTSPKVLALLQASQSALLAQSGKLIPLLPRSAMSQGSDHLDPVQNLLGEFEKLDRDHQDRVARNLVLLWDNFQNMFGGISGFLAAPVTEQTAFMERLQAASERMETARGSDAAFHYVTVELIRLYIAFFQDGRADKRAVSLATCVVSLIDRGRQMTNDPIAYTLKQ